MRTYSKRKYKGKTPVVQKVEVKKTKWQKLLEFIKTKFKRFF